LPDSPAPAHAGASEYAARARLANKRRSKMKIKIVEANRRAINILLGEINGKSMSHTAHDKHVFELAELMEMKLEKFGIPKKDRNGAKASGMSGGNVPSAYKYSRIVNTYQISRGTSDWFLIDAQRTEVWGNADKDQLSLTPSHRDIAVSKFTKQFSVQPAVELAVAA
jgi:hypothetical protein